MSEYELSQTKLFIFNGNSPPPSPPPKIFKRSLVTFQCAIHKIDGNFLFQKNAFSSDDSNDALIFYYITDAGCVVYIKISWFWYNKYTHSDLIPGGPQDGGHVFTRRLLQRALLECVTPQCIKCGFLSEFALCPFGFWSGFRIQTHTQTHTPLSPCSSLIGIGSMRILRPLKEFQFGPTSTRSGKTDVFWHP